MVKVGAVWEVGVGTGSRTTMTVEKQETMMQRLRKMEIKPISRRPNGVRLFHVSVIEALVIIF